MTAKKGKVRISKLKRSNQKRTKLARQGKLKHKRNKKATPKPLFGGPQNPPHHGTHEGEEESDHDLGILDMVDEDDIDFLKNAVSSRSYSLLNKIRYRNDSHKDVNKRKRVPDDDEREIEDKYEEELLEPGNKKTKYLLPIKTKQGIVCRTVEEEEVVNDEDNEKENIPEEGKAVEPDSESDGEIVLDETVEGDSLNPNVPVSTAQLIFHRQQLLQKRKFQIGVLSSGLLEAPETKVKNFKVLLEIMEERTPEIRITVCKLACVSLLEVFKDLLPAYQIKHQETAGVKLKKTTLQLQNYEKSLLKAYKMYLQKLEKLTNILCPKRGNTKVFSEQEIALGKLSVQCLCELLVAHPYFNFSRNLAQMLIPFLNHRFSDVRERVAEAVKTVLKEDKKGEISLDIVRRINHLVKSRSHSVHVEVLGVLLSLRIKDVNLDKEKEDFIKQKKFKTHRQKLLTMSKRERKKSKKLEELEKELLETKAEENVQSKQQNLTEVTKTVFTIYFRVLKQAPSSKLLSVTLEGLARFAHCINLEFYHDLVNVMDHMLENEPLGHREQLHCVETVFTILSGQGDVLNIDPFRFYSHLYRNLLHINAGKSQDDMQIALRTLDAVLIKRRKKISNQRLLAFTKRVSTLALQLLHNGTLSCLALVKTILTMNKSVDILLDLDSTVGQGHYFPELEQPEYCNAGNTALWEMTVLQRHYHPTVRKFASHILHNVPATGEGSLPPDLAKQSPEALYTNFDPSDMAFSPSVPVPKKNVAKGRPLGKINFINQDLENYTENIFKAVNTTLS
ncbi:nucleolar complex protein 3 homolog isoform X1 [Schistocerca piceifrons]|uniref:nucleolar complex protein 3 homolog isoform X1 n=1 Tax=Schistocerca piceifrons TaxID=274613 RepID=UPI001F5E8973|nr:nucleolar complex protein 3 homolog isoform X1 [Schistocerca piceifrons]